MVARRRQGLPLIMKNAIVLGGTTPHIRLIEALRNRGYYVILVDYLDNPPAKEFADIHIKENTLDKDAVLNIAKERNAELVISACIDQANSTCCYVAEKLNLPHPYSFEISLEVTNKAIMKQKMIHGDISTSWFYHGKNLSDIDWDSIVFPAVVKPVDCNSSKGVKRVNSLDEAQECFNKALKLSRTGEALIEGFVSGTEIQVDCYASDDNVDIILCRQKKQISRGLQIELNSTGSIFPSAICLKIQDKIYSTAQKIAETFGLKRTPFFYQAIVDEQDNLYVLEFAPRIGGGLSYYILKGIVGFDPIDAVIESYFGNHYNYSLKPLANAFSTNLLYMFEGVFDRVVGLEEQKNKGNIVEYFVSKTEGTYVDSDMKSGNRVGAFIVKADSLNDLQQKEIDVLNQIDILDTNGVSKIRRWR